MITKVEKWQEFHSNGELWIDGEIGIISDETKHLYKYLSFVSNYVGQAVCRLGKWTKYFDNGQIAWTIDYGDGTLKYESNEKFPSYRRDGQTIVP